MSGRCSATAGTNAGAWREPAGPPYVARKRDWENHQVEWIDSGRRVGLLLAVRAAGPAYQAGFGHGGGRTPEDATFSATLRHVDGGRGYDVQVDTDSGWPESMEPWRLLTDWMYRAVESPEELRFPFELRADSWTADIEVDGVAYEFLLVGDPECWSASARVDGRVVRVRGSGVGSLPVALNSVAPDQVLDAFSEDP